MTANELNGTDGVPPSSIPMAMAFADPPARSCPSFEDVYVQCAKFVWKKLRRRDIAPDSAAGIHQDVFLTLHDQIERYGLPDSLEAMLSTITGHAICNYLRRRARRPRRAIEIEADEPPASSRADIEQGLIDQERRQLVIRLLAMLPGEDGVLIALIDLDGMTHAEAASLFDRPLATVRTQHRRAREKLRVLAERLCK